MSEALLTCADAVRPNRPLDRVVTVMTGAAPRAGMGAVVLQLPRLSQVHPFPAAEPKAPDLPAEQVADGAAHGVRGVADGAAHGVRGVADGAAHSVRGVAHSAAHSANQAAKHVPDAG